MVKMHFKKYCGNYLFLLFIIISFILATNFNKETIYAYYGIAVIIFLLGFKSSYAKELGFSFKILVDREIILFLIPSILLSNFFLFIIDKISKDTGIPYNNSYLILGFIFFNSIRILGEEIIFRGILLIKDFKIDNVYFWLANICQALVFSFIHASIPDNLISKIMLGCYAFALSIYFGWLNRKFNSILPSWIIHWMNGLQTIIFTYLY
jgi:membrane protease YdiL (CAAX protease family)